MANSGFHGDVSPNAAWEALIGDPSTILLDVRTISEWSFVGNPDLSSVHKRVLQIEWVKFPGMARNTEFVEEFKKAGTGKQQPVFIICRSGVRSKAAAELLAAEGYETYNVADGFEGQLGADGHRGEGGWRALGLPWKQS